MHCTPFLHTVLNRTPPVSKLTPACGTHPGHTFCCRVVEQVADAETAAARTVEQAEGAAVACQGLCRREVQGEDAAAPAVTSAQI